jgi:hypothetical protein
MSAPVALSAAERDALEWLLSGNGQKWIDAKAPRPPFEREKRALVETHRQLERVKLVEVSAPDFHGARVVRITPAGRERLRRPCGRTDCRVSTGLAEELTFGRGKLDHNGYWEEPCDACAADHVSRHSRDGGPTHPIGTDR